MKKTLILAIMAGAALAGCVKNEPIATDNGAPSLIKFEAPVVNVPTKATEIVGNYPTDANFAVFAKYYVGGTYTTFNEGQLYMDNLECTKKETNNYWDTPTSYYWPKTGTLTFAAYAPFFAAEDAKNYDVTWDAQGFKFTDFTVQTDASDQYDLLYSDRAYDQTSTNMVTDEPYDGITIEFKHALSSIVFAAKTDADYSTTDNYTIKITGITVKNVVSKGTFNQGLEDKKDGAEHAAWTPSTVEGDKVEYTAYNNNEGLVLGSTTEKYFSGVDGAAPAAANGKRTSDLILLPQTIGDDATVTINYQIKHGSTEMNETREIPLKGYTAQWEMGKRYIYTITIGLNKIYFNPTVVDWVDVPITNEIQIQ